MHSMRLLILISMIMIKPVRAQETPDLSEPDSKQPIEEIVVEASRTGLTLMKMPVNTSILDELTVKNSAQKTVDEILRLVPGFSMLRAADSIATRATTNTVSMRGLGGSAASRTLVLLDGIPMHSPYSSEVFWARIPKHQIERIEVIRGGGANSWGNLALDGVINIVTRKPRAKALEFSGMVSDPATLDVSLAGSRITGRWSFSGEVSYFDTDGYKNLPKDQLGSIDQNVRLDYSNAYGKAAYQISDGASFYVTGSYAEQTQHGGTPLTVDDWEVWSLGTGLDLNTSDGSHWVLRLFYDDSEIEQPVVSVNSERSEESIRSRVSRPTSALGASVVWSRALGNGHALSAGADYRWSDVDIDELSRYLGDVPRDLSATKASQDMGGAFIQDSWSVSDRWQLTGSLRYDYVTNEGQIAKRDLTSGEIRSVEIYDDDSKETLNPNIGARYQATGVIAFRAAVYKGFRAATPRELYRSVSARGGQILVNNPDLKPERLVGREVGADFVFNRKATLRLTLFQNTVEDLIQNNTLGVAGDVPEVIQPCGLIGARNVCRELDNVGEMESNGAELELRYQPDEHWNMYLSYLYNDTEVTRAPDTPQIIGNQIRHAPKNSFTVQIGNHNRFFDTNMTARYVGKRYEDDLNSLPVDDFLVFDLRFSRQLSQTAEVFLSFDNLFDKEYEISVETSGDIEIGRPRFIGLGLRFHR